MVTVIDATGLVLGRLSSNVAKRLLKGEEIVIVNAEKAIISGPYHRVLETYKKKRELTHHRKGPYFPKRPDGILKRTVRGMLPYQQPRGRQALKRLKVYIGVPDEYRDATFETIEKAKGEHLVEFVELGRISRAIGGKF